MGYLTEAMTRVLDVTNAVDVIDLVNQEAKENSIMSLFVMT